MNTYEFLIQEADGDVFNLDLSKGEFEEALKLTSETAESIQGNRMHCIGIRDAQITINDEMPGIQVIFEGIISHERALKLTQELAAQLSAFTGQPSEVIDFNLDLKGRVVSFSSLSRENP